MPEALSASFCLGLTTTCKVDDVADNKENGSQESEVPCRGAQLIDCKWDLEVLQICSPAELWL